MTEMNIHEEADKIVDASDGHQWRLLQAGDFIRSVAIGQMRNWTTTYEDVLTESQQAAVEAVIQSLIADMVTMDYNAEDDDEAHDNE